MPSIIVLTYGENLRGTTSPPLLAWVLLSARGAQEEKSASLPYIQIVHHSRYATPSTFEGDVSYEITGL